MSVNLEFSVKRRKIKNKYFFENLNARIAYVCICGTHK